MGPEYRQGVVSPDKATHVIVRYPLPYAIYLPQREFVVVISGKPAYVTLDLVVSEEIRGFPPNLRVPRLSRLRYDRWGRHGFTMIAISLPRHSWPSGLAAELNNDDAFARATIPYFNKLMRIYRTVCEEYLCDEICERDIHYYQFILIDSTEKVCDVIEKYFPFGVMLHAGPEVTFHSQEAARIVAEMAASGGDIDGFDELTVQSNSFFLKGNYTMAAFFAALSFEFYCKKVIRERYPNSDDDVDGLLESTSMVNLIKHHFSRATGYDFAGTEEFTAWYQFVRPLRNGIAHGSMLYVDKDDAIRVMKIVQSCIEKIRANLS